MDDETIKSKDNARLKAVRAVRDGHDRSHIFIEGVRLAEEALRSPVELIECFCEQAFGANAREAGLLDKISGRGVKIVKCSPPAFHSIVDTTSSQGIVLIAKRPGADATSADDELVLYLHEISDPSNVGAVLRTAEAAGAKSVFISSGSTDPFSPRSLRASMGSAMRLVIREGVDVMKLSSELKRKGLAVVAAAANAPIDHTLHDWACPTLLLIGSEAHGLPESILDQADVRVSIAMENGVESLNLAVSTGILLFEAKRQQKR